MKRIPLVLCLLTILHTLHSQERKTAQDFEPPPPDEKELLGELPDFKHPAAGFWVSTGTTTAGALLSGAALGFTVKSALDRDIPSVNRGVVLTGTGMVLTAISAVVMDFFLEEWRQTRKKVRTDTL